MKRIALVVFALLLSFALVSCAHKPPVLGVTQQIEIRTAPDVVWHKIEDFNGLNTWHPAVAKSEIVAGSSNKAGAVRLLTLKGGGTITEKLLAYDREGRSFTYEILEGVLPVSSYVSTVAVEPGSEGGSVVAWKGSFNRKSMAVNPPAGEDDATAVSTITSVYQAGLENLKNILERSQAMYEHLGAYAEGWTKGDGELILKAAADNFTFNDPNAGVIPKSEFANYLAGVREAVASLRGGTLPEPFMEISEVVTEEKEGVITAWCWWVIPGTDIKGSGLIKVGSEGVQSEVITFYAKLPE